MKRSRLCDRVAIMDHGKVIALGTPRELVASIGAEHMVEFLRIERPGHCASPLESKEFVTCARATAVFKCR